MKERDVENWDGEHPIWLNMTWIIIIILLMEGNDHFRWRIYNSNKKVEKMITWYQREERICD
jgi:hypothetical protein